MKSSTCRHCTVHDKFLNKKHTYQKEHLVMSSSKLAILITLAFLTTLLTSLTHADVSRKNEEISLKDRLVTGLRATRPEEVQYCERVANAARSGKLPAKIVDSTYFWATAKKVDYPLPAFAKALELQCQRLGITW